MMAGYQRKRRRKVAEINVVPYIDVMLVLLIIFMATAPLVTQGVKVDLPQASAEPLSADSKPPLVASVNKEGEYFLDNGSVDERKPLMLDELAALVAAELQINPDRPVVVNGDRQVSYDQIVQLMVSLQSAGVPSVGLMTESNE
ncbi:protein TolR [Ferrimonas balearica]|uniref:protein TolR n=1 Tax=Ferrimonas balearica TaxID=44012 RepID=UPI001C992FC2|nr:protein TolR [Ferrimonas balearica]MBY5920043.1 protein TolR [Ferrimonas balearica]MBY5997272.1 protein TolR [Ferrimonas balearica]